MVTSATKSRKRRRQQQRRLKRNAQAQLLVLYGWEPVRGVEPAGKDAWGVTNGEVVVAIKDRSVGIYTVKAMNFPTGFYRPTRWNLIPPGFFYTLRNHLHTHFEVPL